MLKYKTMIVLNILLLGIIVIAFVTIFDFHFLQNNLALIGAAVCGPLALLAKRKITAEKTPAKED